MNVRTKGAGNENPAENRRAMSTGCIEYRDNIKRNRFMALKSLNTNNMSKIELKALQEEVKEMSAEMLKKFRESFDVDVMGFSGRMEGI